jgi:hypothetical protein
MSCLSRSDVAIRLARRAVCVHVTCVTWRAPVGFAEDLRISPRRWLFHIAADVTRRPSFILARQ